MTEFRGNELRTTGMGDGKVEKERRKFGKVLKEMEERLQEAEIANHMNSIDPYKELETLISDSSLNKLLYNTKFEQVANTLIGIIRKQHRLKLQQTDTMLFMAQQKTVRALKERQDTLNLVKSLQNTLQLEAQYQENIFSQIPRLREMLNDYDKSSEFLQQEEKELKKLLDLQYQRLQNFQHQAYEVEELREQLDLLKGTLTEGEDHIKRPGISEASIKLGETLRQMTSFERAHAGKVTDYIEGLERRRVLEAICGGNGGRVDEAMIDDIIKRVVSVYERNISGKRKIKCISEHSQA